MRIKNENFSYPKKHKSKKQNFIILKKIYLFVSFMEKKSTKQNKYNKKY